MTKEDYFKYYIQGSDHYLIPKDEFEELFNEMVNWKEENKRLKDNWNRLKEIAKSQSGFKKRADLKGGLWFEIDELLDKMQELEQGSDNSEIKNNRFT